MATRPEPIRVGVVQDGARRRYIVPRALQQGGQLGAMYTDWFISPGAWRDRLTRCLPQSIIRRARGLVDRRADDIPPHKVVQSLGLMLKLARARKRFSSPEAFYSWEAEEKGRWLLKRGVRVVDLWMGFVRNIPPNLCQAAFDAGVPVIADQIIAPASVEDVLLQREQQRWPGWDAGGGPDQSATIDLEQRTWPALTRVTCMSPFVRDSLMQCGVDASRIEVIPYPFDATGWQVPDRTRRTGPVTIGFTGSIGLRKGVPYFLEVAKRLRGSGVRFVMVGKSAISSQITQQLGSVIELTGPLPRGQVKTWLEQFDVFYFPSTCEGSAGSVAEAMASGLPVVTTYESGSVARDGLDGYIVKSDDIDTAAFRIECLIRDTRLRHEFGRNARQNIEQYDLNWYARTLHELVDRTITPACASGHSRR